MTASLDQTDLAVSQTRGPLAALVDACAEIAEPLRPGAAPELPPVVHDVVTPADIVQRIRALDEREPFPPLV
jgi:hypothetical protein